GKIPSKTRAPQYRSTNTAHANEGARQRQRRAQVIDLRQGDCLEIMKDIPDGSVDLILTDPPYKTTSRGSSGGTGGMLKSDINKSGMVFKHNTIKFDDWLPKCYRVLKNDSHAYFMTNNKNLLPMLKAVENAGFKIF